jgi:hypothetical protein
MKRGVDRGNQEGRGMQKRRKNQKEPNMERGRWEKVT